jgi:HK97 family phage portal protein
LIGISPIFACGLAAAQGHHIQKTSASFFKNMARPSGVLTAPGAISDESAKRLKENWQQRFSEHGAGGVAVVGDGLKFEGMTMTSVDAQLIEQLKWSGENVCTAFSMPSYMVGIAPPPTYTNIEALTQQYLSQCLQTHIEGIELALDEGLGLVDVRGDTLGVELDLDVLLRMDTATRYATWKSAIGGGWMAPNEARKKENLAPVAGGDTPYMQQQNFSLGALAARDKSPAPSTTLPPASGEQ